MGSWPLLVSLIICLIAATGGLADEAPPGQAALNLKLTAMGDNTWLRLKPKGMAKARTYSGACMGDGLLWYFGGAHRGYKGNDVQLYDPRANEWIQATPETRAKSGLLSPAEIERLRALGYIQ